MTVYINADIIRDEIQGVVHNLLVIAWSPSGEWSYISLDDSSIFYSLNDGATIQAKIDFLLITVLIFQFKYLQYTFNQKVIYSSKRSAKMKYDSYSTNSKIDFHSFLQILNSILITESRNYELWWQKETLLIA